MSNIFFVGCSFTSGINPTRNVSYPYLLSKKYPEHTFYNLGIPGAGFDLQLVVMKNILKGVYLKDDNTVHAPDAIVFQASDFHRTVYRHYGYDGGNIADGKLVKHSNYADWYNYETKPFELIDRLVTLNAGILTNKKMHKTNKRAIEYYKNKLLHDLSTASVHEDIFSLRNYVCIRHLCEVNKIPLVLFDHLKMNGYADFCIEDLAGNKFEEFCIDEGKHFGKAGNEFIANILEDKLKEILNV